MRLPILLSFLFTLAVTPLAALFGAPVVDGPVLVILPPWADGDALVAASGGRLLGPTRAPFALLVALPSPAAVAELRASGAWAVLGAKALAGICGVNDV